MIYFVCTSLTDVGYECFSCLVYVYLTKIKTPITLINIIIHAANACYIAPCKQSQKNKNKSMNWKFHILCCATELFRICILLLRFLDSQL